MKKFVMVPDEFYKSLLSKATIDDFSEQLLAGTLSSSNRSNAAKKHAQYNQRVQGYLDHYNRKANRPVRVVLENGETAAAQPLKPPATTTQETQTETTTIVPKAATASHNIQTENDTSYQPELSFDNDMKYAAANVLQPMKIEANKQRPVKKGTPMLARGDEATVTPKKPSKEFSQRDLSDINKTIKDLEKKTAHSPQAQRKLAKEEIGAQLVHVIEADKKKFGVNSHDKRVLSSSGQPIGGSNYLTIINKHVEGSLKNANGEKPLRTKLLSMPETHNLASMLFGVSPRKTRSNKLYQKGTGFKQAKFCDPRCRIPGARVYGRFSVRNWRI